MADEIKKEDQEVKEEKCCCGCDEAKEAAAQEAEKSCTCDCKDAPAEAKKADSKGVALAKSVLRIVILVVILAVIGFFIKRDKIMEHWYGFRENSTIRTKIEKMLSDGLANSEYKYEITYFDEGKGKNNGYKVFITNDKSKWDFTIIGGWDVEKKEPKIEFFEGESVWKMILNKVAKEEKSKPAETAPVAE